jgi:hypothetical protein
VGEVPGGPLAVGLVDGDVQARVADGVGVTARFAYAVATPASRPVTGAGTPYPFSVLTTTGAGTTARAGAGKKA